ncbi:hypothetical protein AKG10_32980 [Shinella sp. GWS1]|nr:hypothetical protein AKG10_32980 [Shinella sp. GWS1]
MTLASGCQQNVTADVYARDIKDVGNDGAELKVDMIISILATGISDECDKPAGQAIVKAVAKAFADAMLVGCKNIEGSMNDEMRIRATSRLYRYASNGEAPKHLVELAVLRLENSPPGGTLVAIFSKPIYRHLEKQISDINMMAKLDFEKTTFTVNLTNDERDPVKTLTFGGSFEDEVPIDRDTGRAIEPRQKIAIRLGDVKMSTLSKDGAVPVVALTATK